MCVFIKMVCVLITPVLPGFSTFCMQRLTTLPSNHILLSGNCRQQQQVVWPIGILQSGKEGEKAIGGERMEEKLNRKESQERIVFQK